jgi:hypothetical protein
MDNMMEKMKKGGCGVYEHQLGIQVFRNVML